MNSKVLEAIADLLIPAGGDMPCASESGVGTTGIAQVLSFRPELEAPLERILRDCEGKTPEAALSSLEPAAFAMLAETVASAYFMNEQVRAKLNYQGQRAKGIVPEEIDPALLKPVVERGPIYRE